MARSATVRITTPGLHSCNVGAPVLGVAPATLASAAWRRRHGVPFVRVGRLVKYDLAKLRQWAESHQVAGEEGEAAAG